MLFWKKCLHSLAPYFILDKRRQVPLPKEHRTEVVAQPELPTPQVSSMPPKKGSEEEEEEVYVNLSEHFIAMNQLKQYVEQTDADKEFLANEFRVYL